MAMIFKKGLSKNLENTPTKKGQVLVTTDTHKLYIDQTNTKRLEIFKNDNSIYLMRGSYGSGTYAAYQIDTTNLPFYTELQKEYNQNKIIICHLGQYFFNMINALPNNNDPEHPIFMFQKIDTLLSSSTEQYRLQVATFTVQYKTLNGKEYKDREYNNIDKSAGWVTRYDAIYYRYKTITLETDPQKKEEN